MEYAETDLKPGVVYELPIEDLLRSPDQVRPVITDESFEQLVESIRESGVLQPIGVRLAMGYIGKPRLRPHVIFGHRRVAAAKEAGRTTVPAVYHNVDDAQAAVMTAIENMQRKNLTPFEESATLEMLENHGLDVQAMAKKLSRSVHWCYRRLSLKNLAHVWKAEALKSTDCRIPEWKAAHFERIARLPKETQEALFRDLDLADPQLSPARLETIRHMTFKELEQAAADFMRDMKHTRWKIDDATLLADAGACSACPKRSSQDGMLFNREDEEPKAKGEDTCLDGNCWDRKRIAYVELRRLQLRAQYSNLVLLRECFSSFDMESIRKQDTIWAVEVDQSAKKNTKGAVPALWVDGPQAGTLKWVLLPAGRAGKGTPASGSSGGSSKSMPAADTPTPLRERRERLKVQRKRRAIQRVRVAMDHASCLKDLVKSRSKRMSLLLRLLVAFEEPESYGRAPKAWDEFDRLADHDAIEEAIEHVWGQVRHSMENVFLTAEIGHAVTHAKRIAALCGESWEKITTDIETELPEPESWKRLKADGTPKKKPGAKKKAKTKTGGKKKARRAR